MVVKEVLPDGLTLLFERVPGVRSVSVGVWLRMGSRHEPARLSGICHFIEHLVFKGTETRSARDISLLTDRIGGNLDAFTSREMTCFYARALDEHLPIAVDLLADIVRHPRFEADELERERNVILEEIRMVQDSPEDRVFDLFTESFWPGHPLGRPIQGTIETVSGMSRETVRRWFRKAYVPPNIVVSAAGHLAAAARRRIREAFANLPGGKPARTGRPPRWRPGIVRERRKELEQVHLLLGVPALPAGHDERYVLHVLNTILGGSISSRLFHRIREERGLAYAVSSQVHTYTGAGLLSVYVGTAPRNAGEVVRLALAELSDLANRAPSDEEVDVARDHLKGNLLLALESTSSRMTRAAREEMIYGRSIGLDELTRKIDAVTPERVRDLAGRLFTGVRAGLAAVGETSRLRIRPEQLDL